MPVVAELFELARGTALAAGRRLLDASDGSEKTYEFSASLAKEVKARADAVMESEILARLAPAGLEILSEESGVIAGSVASDLRFIVDPLDGTFNYVRSLGPSAVSIGLWRGMEPVMGVIYRLDRRELSWGGPGLGAFTEGHPIRVSAIGDAARGVICTGFPARLNTEDEAAMSALWRGTTGLAKVRMIGSAAVSLLNVASGACEVYAEQKIMLWDVAAGLALVLGAGGEVHNAATDIPHAFDVRATNGRIA